MKVQLPILYFNPASKDLKPRRKGREFHITNDASIRTITEEIHANPAIDPHGVIQFNLPDDRNRYTNPILTMESDSPGIPLKQHKRIALYVGKQLHKRYRCQVQIVWSGNKSYHIHFRINRRNLVKQECVAIQQYLTVRMERHVRKRFKLPAFAFDRQVTNKLELVRFGDGIRLQVDPKSVNIRQKIIKNFESDFDDVETIFPMNDKIKLLLKTDKIRQGRSRANRKVLHMPPGVSDKNLAAYGEFLNKTDSTVKLSRWAYRRTGGDKVEPIIICYYSSRDPNPSCVLGLDSYFTTDSRGKKHSVGWSFNDFMEATKNDFRYSNAQGKSSRAPKKHSAKNPEAPEKSRGRAH